MTRRRLRHGRLKDRYSTAGSAVLFGTSSGALSVLVPLVLLANGELPAVVGMVAIVAGLSQLGMRFFVPQLMRFVPDRALVCGACVLVVLAAGCAWASSAVASMVLVQLVHGAARALFWTGLQTHAVRSDGSAVRGLAKINLFAGFGLMSGPAMVGGILHISGFESALQIVLAIGLLGAASGLLIERFAPFEARRGAISKSVWTAETRLGSWMSGVAGGWRGILDAYVPVILVAYAYSESATSLLIAASNGAILVGSVVAVGTSAVRIARIHVVGVLMTAAALTAVGLFGATLIVALLGLVAGGIASGLLQTAGPAVATESVVRDDRGDAIAVTGIFRSSAILGFPGLMVLAVSFLPVGAVFLVSGACVLGALIPPSVRTAGVDHA